MGKFKRCERCGRIILADSETCRYCQGTCVEMTPAHSSPSTDTGEAAATAFQNIAFPAKGLAGKMKDRAQSAGRKIGQQASEKAAAAKAAYEAHKEAAAANAAATIEEPATTEVPVEAPAAEEPAAVKEQPRFVYHDEEEKSSSKKWIIILPVVITVVGIGIAAYFLIPGGKTSTQGGPAESEEVVEEATVAEAVPPVEEQPATMEPEITGISVYEGTIGKSTFVMILDSNLNGKYYYTSTGNATDNYLMLYNNYDGYEWEGKEGSTDFLREFDKDMNQIGTFRLDWDGNGNITSCVYTRGTDGKDFEVTLQPSATPVADLDPNFSQFIEEYIPLIATEIGESESCD